MKNYRGLFRNSAFSVLALTLVGATYFGEGLGLSPDKHRDKAIQIQNLTESLQVMRAERHNAHINVELRNVSNRSIISFVIASALPGGGLFTVQEEFAYSENDTAITPGSNYQKEFSIPSSLGQQQGLSFTLLVVIFDDKAYEGDQETARKIADERLGQKIQLLRAASLLQKKLELSDSELQMFSSQGLGQELEKELDTSNEYFVLEVRKVKPLSTSGGMSDDNIPEDVNRGAKTAKESILQNVQAFELSKGNDALRQQLLSLKKRYEKIIRRL